MSMISGLIDKLNKSADEWNASNMFELAHMCRDAADTIWQLRDDLQRANEAVRDAEHDESMAWDRVRKAEAESAKLRETIRLRNEQLNGMGEMWVERGVENYKLRKERDTYRDLLGCMVHPDPEQLAAENKKLRGLLLDVADVLGKNEKLRELVDRLRSAASDGAGNACEASAENAKLRKLLLDVWNGAMQVEGFWDGEIYDEDEVPHYQERTRELGVKA